jgi:hypothetical protein
MSRRADTTLAKALSVFSQVSVSANEDGTLAVDLIKDASGSVRKWEAVGPLLFREVGGQDLLAFRRDDSGTTQLVWGMFPVFIAERVGWRESWILHRILLFGSIGLLALTLVSWPVGWMVRRHYGQQLALERTERRRRLAVRLLCALTLGVLAGWVALLSTASEAGTFSDPLDPWLRALQIGGVAAIAGSVLAAYHAFDSWRRPGRWFWSRVWETLLALAFLGLALFVVQWHFVHWSVKY